MRIRISRSQAGGVAIIVALSLVALVGFAGLVLDLGRLYVNKSELQTAADACALAAAAELTCDVNVAGACTAAYLASAETAGAAVGDANRRDLQGEQVAIIPGDIRFGTGLAQPNPETGPLDSDTSYLPKESADPASKFVMCSARSNGILPWFMGVMGFGAANVRATAVATLGPTQNFCSTIPLGLCAKSSSSSMSSSSVSSSASSTSCAQSSSGSNFGYRNCEWISSDFHGETLDGGFRWVDFTPAAGGTSEIRDQLSKPEAVCDLRIGSNVVQAGVHQGAKSAYNTRFGIYTNQYSPALNPPDYSGFAFPSKDPSSGDPVIGVFNEGAYDEYMSNKTARLAFDPSSYDDRDPVGKLNTNNKTLATSADLNLYGRQRRLSLVPIIDCNAGNNITPIIGMACVLMLNPMADGAKGKMYLQFVTNAGAPGDPCRTSGTPGGGGPLAPVLVQ